MSSGGGGDTDALDKVVDGLELGVHGPSLVQVQAAADRLLAKLRLAYGHFDHAELWDLDAATSMTAWLRDRTAMVSGDAARVARSAKRLRVLPLTAAAAVDGRLSAGQVRAIVARVSPRTVGLFAEHEAEMVALLAPMSTADVASAMGTWAALAEAPGTRGSPRTWAPACTCPVPGGAPASGRGPGCPVGGDPRHRPWSGSQPRWARRAGQGPRREAGRRSGRHLPLLPGTP